MTEETTPEETPTVTPVEPASDATLEGGESLADRAARFRTVNKQGDHLGTGRRKTAVARVRLREGGGLILVNRREFKEFFCAEQDRQQVLAPLQVTDMVGKVDLHVSVDGGGPTGQAGAVRMGLARALCSLDINLEGALRDAGHLTRDSRMKERKKYGQRGARRRFQFSKR